MAREDRELLFPLMDRMADVAALITDGRAVDPDYIEEGIGLWARFVNELHDKRIRRLIAMIPPDAEYADATPGPRRRRGFARLRRRLERSPLLSEEYLGVRGEQARMAERLKELRTFLMMYRTGGFYGRQLLGSLLHSGAFSDRAWARYEEEFVLHRLTERLPFRADAGLGEEVLAASRWRNSFEGAVRAFLERPIPVAPTPPTPRAPPPRAPGARVPPTPSPVAPSRASG